MRDCSGRIRFPERPGSLFGGAGYRNRFSLGQIASWIVFQVESSEVSRLSERNSVRSDQHATLYLRWRPAILDLLARRLGNLEEAENLAQEALLRALDASNVQRIENFAAYAMRIANNLATDTLRRRRFGSDVAPENQLPPMPDNPNAAEFRRLRKAVGNLDEAERNVILLRYDTGLSFAEIAAELGMSKNGVFARHNRALDTLRDMFAIRRM